MDKLNLYRKYVEDLLTKYASYSSSEPDVEAQLVFDRERDHYQLTYIGWEKHRRIYGVAIHIDIKDSKVWLQHNGTEVELGEELAQMGIPKQDIVIGFHSPSKRRFTEYAVG
ncbi:XisI protein [Nostoc calcicola FACHB-389]|nr:XisI protein [Nostoc calcicola FACHB-3891]OKH34180.1 XisI protein [Nostoc calcicola FACHB-389]